MLRRESAGWTTTGPLQDSVERAVTAAVRSRRAAGRCRRPARASSRPQQGFQPRHEALETRLWRLAPAAAHVVPARSRSGLVLPSLDGNRLFNGFRHVRDGRSHLVGLAPPPRQQARATPRRRSWPALRPRPRPRRRPPRAPGRPSPGGPERRSGGSPEGPHSGSACRWTESRRSGRISPPRHPRPHRRTPLRPRPKQFPHRTECRPCGRSGERRGGIQPVLADRERRLSFGTTTVASFVSSSMSTSRTRAGERALATNRANSVFHGMMSIFSPRTRRRPCGRGSRGDRRGADGVDALGMRLDGDIGAVARLTATPRMTTRRRRSTAPSS